MSGAPGLPWRWKDGAESDEILRRGIFDDELAAEHIAHGVRFEVGDIAEWSSDGDRDVGGVDIDVDLHVYSHVLPATQHAVEWVKGTTLTRFRSVKSAEAYDEFLDDDERALVAEMGATEPCFFPFNRNLRTASLPT